MGNNIQWLYDNLSEQGVELGTIEQFQQAMTDKASQEWVYKTAKSKGLDLGTPDQFASAMVTSQQVSSQSSSSAQPSGVSGGSLLSEKEELVRQNAIQEATNDPNHPFIEPQTTQPKGRELKMDEVIRPKGYENLTDEQLDEQIAQLSGNVHEQKARELYKVRYGKDYVEPEEPKGWWERYFGNKGREYANERQRYAAAVLDAYRIEELDNPGASKRRDEQLATLKQEKAYRDRQVAMPKLGEEIKNLQQRILSNEKQDGNDMRGAKHLLNQTIDLYNAPSKYGRGSGIANWGQGLADQITDYDTWTAGVTELVRYGNLNGIVNKMNKGGYDTLTKEEQLLLETFLMSTAVQDMRSDLSTGYEIGKGAAESIPFMVEMYLTAGAGAAAKRGLVQLAERKVGNAFAEKLARSLGGTAIRDAAGNLVERGATQTVAGKVGKTLAYDFAQTAAMPSTYSNIYKDRATEILQGDGNYGFMDLARSFTGQMVETGTERWGGRLIDRGMSKMIPIDATALWGKNKLFGHFVENYINSPIGETGEEVIAAGVNTLRSINPLYYHTDDKSVSSNKRLRDELGEMLTPEGLGKTFLTILPMSIFGGGANAAMNRIAANAVVRDYGQSRQALQSLLESSGATPEEANRIVNQIEASDSDRAFFDKMNMAYNNLLNKYMMDNPNVPIEDVKAYQQQLDKVLGDYTKQAGVYNQMVGDLMEKYEKLSDNEKRTVDSAMEDYMVRAAEEFASKQQPQDRQTQLRQQAAQQAQQEVSYITHDDGNVYHVGIKGKDGVDGYVRFGNLGVQTNADGIINASGKEIVTIKMTDGTVEQVPADELTIIEAPQSAQERIEQMTDHYFAQYANNDLFHVGDKVYLKQNGQQSAESSTIVGINDEGIEVEIIDPNGQPNTTIIPHEQAAEALAVAEGETEDNIVTYVLPDNTQLRLRNVGDGVYEDITPGGTGTIHTEEDLANMGAKPLVQEEAPANTSDNGMQAQEVAQPAYPTDETGNPAWEQMEVPQSAQVLYDLYKGNRESAKAYADDQLKEAQRVQKAAAKQASHNLNIAQRMAEEEQNAQFKAQADAAVMYWEDVKLAIAQIKTAEELAAEQAQREKLMEAREQRSKTEAGTVTASTMAERYAAADKIEGNTGTITLPDGRELAGHYVLIAPQGVTTSHDVTKNFRRSDGYPVTSNGQSINDRDYTSDKEEQQKVVSIAQNFNGNAIKNMPVISDDGMVYNGNGRMMAGQLAAINGTDAAYTQSLMNNAAQYGFTPEQVASIPNARVVFQLDERLPYSTQSLAIFNEQETQTQSNTGKAAGYARKLTPQAVSDVLSAVEGFNTIDAFFSDKKAPFNLINSLINSGIIAQREKAEMVDGDKLSATGRERLSNILFGTVFDNETIRLMGDDAALKNSILRALPQILDNKSLGEFSLESDINDAIRLLYQVRNSGMPFRSFVSQTVIAEDGQVHTAAEGYSPYQLLLAEEMSEGGVDAFRDVLTAYNNEARNVQGGQVDIFGDLLTPTELKNLILQRYGKEPNEQERPSASRQTDNSAEGTPASNEQEVSENPDITHESAQEFKGQDIVTVRKSLGHWWVITSQDVRDGRGYYVFDRAGYGRLELHTDVNNNNIVTAALFSSHNGPAWYAAHPEARLAQAEAETDTNPTEAQKKAENYKQGHVTLWGLPITIENPKGSIRRGTDANGKQWEQEMNNTYGKIRRTEGVDGDHIDVFIGPNLTSDKVFVVDQRNVDTGEFDEHKCMLGFDSLEDAQNGYLSNYEPGWQGMGTVTEVTMDEFKKWIDSSHRKTKPFAEYKSVKTEGAASTAMEEQPMPELSNEPLRKALAKVINGFELVEKTGLSTGELDMLEDEVRKLVKKHNAPTLQSALDAIDNSFAEQKARGVTWIDTENEQENLFNVSMSIIGDLFQAEKPKRTRIKAQTPSAPTDNRETTETQATEKQLTPFEQFNLEHKDDYHIGDKVAFYVQGRVHNGELISFNEENNSFGVREWFSKRENKYTDYITYPTQIKRIIKKAESQPTVSQQSADGQPTVEANVTATPVQEQEQAEPVRAKHAFEVTISDINGFIDRCANNYFKNYALNNDALDTFYDQQVGKHIIAGAPYVDGAYILEVLHTANEELDKLKGKRDKYSSIKKRVFSNLVRDIQAGLSQPVSVGENAENSIKDTKNAKNSTKNAENLQNSLKSEEKVVNLQPKTYYNHRTGEYENLPEGVEVVGKTKSGIFLKVDGDGEAILAIPRTDRDENGVFRPEFSGVTYQINVKKGQEELAQQIANQKGYEYSPAQSGYAPARISMQAHDDILDLAVETYRAINNPPSGPAPTKQKRNQEQTTEQLGTNNSEVVSKQPRNQQQTNFESNSVFTADAVAEARKRLAARRNRLNMGLNPEDAYDYTIIAGAYVEQGVRKFADFCKAMIQDLGDAVRPYLQSIYDSLRHDPQVKAQGWQKDFDSHDVVDNFDVDNFAVEEEQPEEQMKAAFEVGQKVKYYNKVDKTYHDAEVESVNADGTYNITTPSPIFGDIHMNNISEDRLSAIEEKPKEPTWGDTPMGKQFKAIKEQYPDAMLIFRVGDFYELYDTDAEQGSKILGITLTKTSRMGGVRMAGFPFHALDTYLPKLVRAGWRVAICDQLEDPKLTTKTVKRGVTELVETPKVESQEVAEPESVTDNQEPTIPEPNVVTDTVGEITESKHTKTGAPIWVVNPLERVGNDEFRALRKRAKENNGYYSTFVKGYVFNSVNDANRFNNISDVQTTTEQGRADSEAAISTAETASAEAAAIRRDSGDTSGAAGELGGESVETGVSGSRDVELTTDQAAKQTQERKDAIQKIDEATERIDKQLTELTNQEEEETPEEEPAPTSMSEVVEQAKKRQQKAKQRKQKLEQTLDLFAEAEDSTPALDEQTEPINNEDNGSTEVRNDGQRKGRTQKTGSAGQPADQNGTLGGSQRQANEGTQSGGVGSRSEQHRVHDGERGLGTAGQRSTESVERKQSLKLSYRDEFGVEHILDAAYYQMGDVYHINDRLNGDQYNVKAANVLKNIKKKVWTEIADTPVQEPETPIELDEVGQKAYEKLLKTYNPNTKDWGIKENIEGTKALLSRDNLTDELRSKLRGELKALQELLEKANAKNTHNFRYDPNDPAPTSPKARYDANMAAIRLLKQLQDEGRQATPEEQRVLAKFTGWGGLGEYFKGEPGTTYYAYNGEKSPYQIIKELLTDEELAAAQLSRNSAYYTPTAIIDHLWNIAERLGFKGGNILEGSAGIGNILAQMPQSISDRSNLQAVEIDDITAGILAQLYPDAETHHSGFEKVDIPNNSQDLVITNVPFVTGLRVHDPKEKDLSKRFRSIHDFCIAKNVRKLRQGGIGIFITTSGTLDNSKDLRAWLNTEGETDVIGAFRLNRETFGGTSATSDIIVVRKRVNGQKDPRAIDVLDTDVARVAETEEDGKNVEKKLIYNRYFVEHPENMGGEMGFGFEHGDTWRGNTAGCFPSPAINQSQRMQDWVESIPTTGDVQTVTVRDSNNINPGTYEEYHGDLPYGSLVLNSKDEICRVYNGMVVPVEGINPTKVKGHEKSEVLTDYNALKAAVEELLAEQAKGISDDGLKGLLRKLNKAYDDFVNKYGNLNRNVSLSFLRNDVQWASMAALENVRETIDKSGKKQVEVSKTDVFSKRVVGVQAEPKAENARDGVILSVQQYGNVRPDRIAEWLGKPQDEVEKEIIASRLAFRDPQTGNMVVSHEYLSGNVREKLAYAEAHNENGEYDTNIEELRKVIPVDIPAHLIEFNIGSTWIPVELYHEYLKEKFGVDSLQLTHVGSAWLSNEKSWGTYTLHGEKNRSEGVYSDLLQQQIYGHQLMIAAMNNVPVVVSRVEKHYDGSTETITDKVATAACSDKISQIKDDFVEWARGKMQKDPELAERVQKIYNERFNAIVPMLSVDKAFLSPHLPGQNPKYTLYDHQQQAVVRGTTQPIMLAHEVGTGKTITLISTAMEMRRLGTAKKPMIVVQNATTPQFVKEAKDLYPNAKILTVSERDRTKEGRQEFYAKIKYNDWDLIIVPQSVFDMIPDSEARMRDFIQDKIDEKLHAIEAAKEAKVDEKVTKRMERELEALKEDLQNANMSGKKSSGKKSTEKDAKKEAERIANATAQAEEMLDRRTDDVEDFDDMGIDALLIDEAHNYKHLGFATMMTRGVKGIDPSYSKRAAALYLKCQSIYERCGHRNVVFATGTPISNTAAEIWTFMKYLMPKEVLKDNDIYYFDDFVHNFGKINEQLEFATNGKFKANNRFAQYGNVPELMRIWLTCADCVLTREVGQVNDKVPELEGGKAQDIFLPQSPSLIDIMASVREELDRYEKMSGKEKKENSHIPLTMYGVAKRAAIDPRLVDASAADEPLSKTNKAVEETLRSLKETKKYNGTVAIFCDSYRNLQTGFNLFEDIKAKLVKAGVPAAKIAIIRSEMTDAAKQKIFDAVREGEIRVIMGSTQTLGTGVNIQTRLHTLIHMDAPDRPMDYTQRNGRIIRQGNMHRQWNLPVRVLRFGVEDSLDVTSYQRLKTKAGFIDSIMNGKSMIDNNLENRVLEDVEEGIFDNPVAMLSGSQYALLKSQAERDLRKWQARKQQHDIDQILIASGLKKNASIIEYRKNLIATDEKFLQQLKETFPTGKVTEYNINGTICHTPEEVKAALKAVNKDISDQSDALRKNGYEGDKRNVGLALQFNGMTFNVNIVLTYKSRWEGGQRAITIDKEVQYTTPTSDTWLASPTKVIDKLVENIEQDYLSGAQAKGEINYSRSYIARLQQESELMRQREGKPFEHTAELERAQALVDEYTEKMKAELAEKEAKYANQSSGRVVTLNEQEDEEETPEAQITSLDYPQFRNQTEAQQLATAALVEVLNDNTDLDVFLATDEEAKEIQTNTVVIQTFTPEFSFRPFGGNSGYVGYSKSKRAVAAENSGLRNKSQMDSSFIEEVNKLIQEDNPNAPKVTLQQVKASLNKITADEWHHTSMYGNQTNYYSAESIARYFTPETEDAKQQRETEEQLMDERLRLISEIEAEVYESVPHEFKTLNLNGYTFEPAVFKTSDGNFVEHYKGQRISENGISDYKSIRLAPAGENYLIDDLDSWRFEHDDEYQKAKEEYNEARRKAYSAISQEKKDRLRAITQRLREAMLTPNGTLYGWAIGDRIYLTKDGLNPNSPIHEYSHIWAKAMMRNNSEGWQSIVNIFKDTPFWDEVVNDPKYQGLTTDDAICSEVLARYSGQRGAARMEEWAKEEQYEAEQSGSVLRGAKVRQLINRAKKALADFWHWVGVNLFGIKHFDSTKQVADRVLYDMLNGTELDVTADREMQHIKDRAIADGTFMKAPNGQPTNLNERQWLQVRTRAFKRWFGDWENDPQNASKVVDANGEPMVVYHGTAKDFTVFGEGKKGWRTSKLRTFYFTPDYRMAMIHSGYSRPGDNGIRRHKIMPSFLNARNIKVVENAVIEDVGYWATDSQLDEFELTYDGLLSQDGKQYVMLHPNQIKSATNNNGDFSEENDDIEMMISGYTQEKQRTINEWYAAHPRPQYQVGEKLEHYQARLEQWNKEYKQFRASMEGAKSAPIGESTTNPRWKDTQTPTGNNIQPQEAAPAFVPGVRPTPMANETPYEYALRLRQYYQLMRDERLVAEYVAEINNQADAAAKVLKKNTIVRGLLDAAKPIENFQEWMKQRGATITDESNAYTDTFLATGRVTEANEQMQRDIIRPLAKQIAKIIAPDAKTGKSRLDGINIVWHNMDVAGTGSKLDGKALTPREIIGVYCQAKDCAEAIEKGLPDRGAKGFLNNLGMSHDDVIAAVESVIPRAELDELWRLINAATHFALNYDYESGRISEDTHTEFYQREFYVPQRGWRERDESGLITEYEPVGKRGNDPYNAALVKAHGRQSLASDPFAYIMSIDASSIVSSENNKIKQKFLQFCLDNEDLGLQTGAFRVKKYWIMNVIDPETGKIKLDEEGNPMMEVSYVAPSAEDLSHDRTIKELIKKKRKEWAKVNQSYLERQSHGELGPQLEAAYKTKLSKIEQAIEDLEQQMHIAWNATNTNITQRTSDEKKQHEVRVLLDGQEYLIEVQDEKLANAINKKFKQHQEQLFNTSQKMRNATRFMSAVLTQYNPEFAASNFARDFQVALATLTAEHPELVGSFLKNFAACQPAVWQYAFNDKVRDRAVFRDSELGRYLHEYFKAGAATGFSYMQDLKSLRQDFDAMVNESNLRRGIKGAVGTLSMLTEVSETAVRFAGYVSARQKGMGINEAAYLSKELTTNFDRAGEVADSGWMSWFSFFRATLNGNIKFLKALKKMPVAYSIIAAAYVALTYLQNLIFPNSASFAIQFRASEALCVLALFTPTAIPGLTVGCLLFNLSYAMALPLDPVIGTLATFLATGSMYLLRNAKPGGWPLLALLMPALFNALLVGWELELYIGGGFWLNAIYVAIGEAAVLLTLGTLLYFSLKPHASRLK